MLSVENPRLHQKLLNNEFNNVAGYKINIQNSIAFLYTDNKLSERVMNNNIYRHATRGKKKDYAK